MVLDTRPVRWAAMTCILAECWVIGKDSNNKKVAMPCSRASKLTILSLSIIFPFFLPDSGAELASPCSGPVGPAQAARRALHC